MRNGLPVFGGRKKDDNSGTDDGDNANNLYFNNLSIVLEPSRFALLAGPVLLGAWFFVRRRRPA